LGEVLEPGRNCWRSEHAARVGLLVDGASYFECIADALEGAQRTIYLVGWDFHSRVRLRRRDGLEETLAQTLNRLASSRPELQIYMLCWDFTVIYALEREMLTKARFDFSTHHRVRFCLDGEHPLGGSHHQKLVVIDDAIAFVGGFDLTISRWDTPAHERDDPRRTDPGLSTYAPFHDVQMAVDGAAAAALGELARERWRRASSERLEAPAMGPDPWPRALEPSMRDVMVGIARTEPAYRGRHPVREVQKLYEDALEAARRFVYVENQFLTSHRVGALLEDLLLREHGPEIVLVGPYERDDWIEEETLGVLRRRMMRRLRDADRHGRLRLLYPVLGRRAPHLNVHSKLMVVDDRLLMVGSANISNRSMGLDTECNLAIEACGRRDLEAAIGESRDRLLAEHLGVEPARVRESLRREGSLIAAIDHLRGGERTLEELPDEEVGTAEQLVTAEEIVDPEQPINPDAFVRRFLPEHEVAVSEAARRRSRRKVGLGILFFGALAAAWRFTPLSEEVSIESLFALAEPLRESPWGPLVAIASFVVAGMLMVPVTVLIVVTGLVFDGLTGFATALAGALGTAGLGYALGASLWKGAVQRLLGKRAATISRQLAKRGVLTIVALRIVPVAPFTVVNLAAGASHIRWRDYAFGTLLGMTPGVLALTFVASRVPGIVRDPRPQDIAALVAIVLALFGGGALLRRWILRQDKRKNED
jgi:phospholipase D1/2